MRPFCPAHLSRLPHHTASLITVLQLGKMKIDWLILCRLLRRGVARSKMWGGDTWRARSFAPADPLSRGSAPGPRWGAPSGTPSGVQGQIPCSGGQRGKAPWRWKTLAFGCPTEAANLRYSLHFANSLNPGYMWYICQRLTVSSTLASTIQYASPIQYCVNR